MADLAGAAQQAELGIAPAAIRHVAAIEDLAGRHDRQQRQHVGDLPPRRVEEHVVQVAHDVREQPEVADSRVGEDEPRLAVLGRQPRDLLAERRDPAPRVEEHRQPPLGGEGDEVLDDRMRQPEVVRARVQLDPVRACVDAPPRLGERLVGVGVDPAERHQPPARRRHLAEHAVVGRRVAVGLGGREDDGALVAGTVQAGEQLLRRGGPAVGVVEAGVGVGVHPARRVGQRRARRLQQRQQDVVVGSAGDRHERGRLRSRHGEW